MRSLSARPSVLREASRHRMAGVKAKLPIGSCLSDFLAIAPKQPPVWLLQPSFLVLAVRHKPHDAEDDVDQSPAEDDDPRSNGDARFTTSTTAGASAKSSATSGSSHRTATTPRSYRSILA
jgi:hypothetical protein